jgi:hypothetical protein
MLNNPVWRYLREDYGLVLLPKVKWVNGYKWTVLFEAPELVSQKLQDKKNLSNKVDLVLLRNWVLKNNWNRYLRDWEKRIRYSLYSYDTSESVLKIISASDCSEYEKMTWIESDLIWFILRAGNNYVGRNQYGSISRNREPV